MLCLPWRPHRAGVVPRSLVAEQAWSRGVSSTNAAIISRPGPKHKGNSAGPGTDAPCGRARHRWWDLSLVAGLSSLPGKMEARAAGDAWPLHRPCPRL